MITTLHSLIGANELTADQLDVVGGLIPPIDYWLCLLIPETCYPWL